jgi:hypothetical protein
LPVTRRFCAFAEVLLATHAVLVRTDQRTDTRLLMTTPSVGATVGMTSG